MRKNYPVLRRKRMVGGKFGTRLTKWLGQINKFLKRHRVLSSLGSIAANPSNPYAQLGLNIAKQEGYGRRRVVRRRRRRGGSLMPVGGGITSLAAS